MIWLQFELLFNLCNHHQFSSRQHQHYYCFTVKLLMDAISLNNGCIQPHLIAARETRLESAAQNLRLYFEQGAEDMIMNAFLYLLAF